MNRTTAIRALFALFAIAFFAAPVALRAVGVTAEAFENRRFAEAPKLSQGWDAFAQTTQFLIDRMPLRADAVRLNTRIWTDVFDTQPRYAGRADVGDEALPFAGSVDAGGASSTGRSAAAGHVLAGDDGWLFLREEIDRPCSMPLSPPRALARWERLVRAIRASGRPVVLIVAPDKGSIYPERLPDDYAGEDCAPRGKRAVWDAVAAAGDPAVVGLRDELLRRKAELGDDLYAQKDSHWTTIGSLTLLRAALDHVGTGVRVTPREVVDTGRAPYTGDLTTLLGQPEEGTLPAVAIERGADAPKVGGRAVLVGDSFSNTPLGQLRPYFESLRQVVWLTASPDEVAGSIAAADTVILETVERELATRAADGGMVESVLRLLAKDLPQRQ